MYALHLHVFNLLEKTPLDNIYAGCLHVYVCVCVGACQVLCIGPTGTGKTLTMSDKLLRNMSTEYITHFLMFSARTSANQTQDYIDSKLDKRYGAVLHTLPTPIHIISKAIIHL